MHGRAYLPLFLWPHQARENAVFAPAPISFDELNASDRGQGAHILLLSVSCCVYGIDSINQQLDLQRGFICEHYGLRKQEECCELEK